MVSIQKPLLSILSLNKFKFDLAAKAAKIGLGLGIKVLAGSTGVTGVIGSLYVQYKLAESAFTVVSGYAGQYRELENGYKKVGFTPNKLGDFFSKVAGSENSWDILKYQFDSENIKDVQKVLKKVYESVDNPEILQVMTAQALTKLLVNKNAEFLQEGLEISIPVIDKEGNRQLVKYKIDKKFDLWNGIPAYGFKDPSNKHSPLLLFRSTNTTLEEKDTLPTLVANLHPKGPAWKLFSNSEQEIQSWLEGLREKSDAKARLMGFSQGGVLGAYFLTYHPEYFSNQKNESSFLLDAPGVSKIVAADWQKIEKKPKVSTFVNRGDLIPKIGDSFIGRAFEVRIAQNLKGFKSHQALSLFAPQWKIVEIAVHGEKSSTSRGVISNLQKTVGKAIYLPVKKILLPCVQSIHN